MAKSDQIRYTPEFVWPGNYKRIDAIQEWIDGGGGHKPSWLGSGLKIVGNTLTLDMSPQATSGSTLPISSNSVMNEIDKAEEILGMI